MNLRNLAVWGVIGMILIAPYSLLTSGGNGSANELSYSQLMAKVDAGQIREASQRGDLLTAKDADGTVYTSVVPPSSDDMMKRMEANNVD